MRNKNEVKKFVIISTSRSGSTLLATLLNSHPRILCHRELFHKSKVATVLGIKDNSEQRLEERDRNPCLFLRGIFDQTFGYEIIGFKIHLNQNTEVLDYLNKTKDITKIILKRRNLIKQEISRQMAYSTGLWKTTIQRDSQPKIILDLDYAKDRIKENQRRYAELLNRLNKNKQKYRVLFYEDLIEKDIREKTLRGFLPFLGAHGDEIILKTPLKKQNADRVEDLVKNLDDLKNAFRGTEIERMIEE
ncbi:MAG: Stf0 family sulfotransferase [bacterium]|nr:Stf0 family sulfotransferase [bacterium]